METGYVKFFDTREGKLFGFLVDEMGKELFFHYSNGCEVGLDGNNEITFKQTPPRYPKKGDYLRFKRGQNAKGAKATAWCLEREYEEMVEKRKRNLTFEEAKKYLADKMCDILEYTDSTTQYGTVITSVTTKLSWIRPSGVTVVADGEYFTKTTRWANGEENTWSEFRVSVHAPNPEKFKLTHFISQEALALKEVGKAGHVRRGKKQGILWNGGWDDYVVDANLVRDMTDDEVVKHDKTSFPTFEDGNHVTWLRCLFAKNLGHATQVVKVLAHLGGGD
jgi:cold shock CspA family protein